MRRSAHWHIMNETKHTGQLKPEAAWQKLFMHQAQWDHLSLHPDMLIPRVHYYVWNPDRQENEHVFTTKT